MTPTSESPLSRPAKSGLPDPDPELVLRRRCDEEATLKRALPLAVIFGGGVAAIHWKLGTGTKAGRNGLLYQVLAASAIGFLGGRASYTGECEKKFLHELPGSETSRRIRLRRNVGPDGPELEVLAQKQKVEEEVRRRWRLQEQQESSGAAAPALDPRVNSYEALRVQHHEREERRGRIREAVRGDLLLREREEAEARSRARTNEEKAKAESPKVRLNQYGDEVCSDVS